MAYSYWYTGLTLCENCGLVYLDLESDAYKLYQKIQKNNGLFCMRETNVVKEESYITTKYLDHDSEMAESKRKVLKSAECMEPRHNVFPKKSSSIYDGISSSNFKYVFNCEYNREKVSFVGYDHENYQGYDFLGHAVANVEFDEKYSINNLFENLILVERKDNTKPSKCPCCHSENTLDWKPIMDNDVSYDGGALLHNIFGYDFGKDFINRNKEFKDADENSLETIPIVDIGYRCLYGDKEEAIKKTNQFLNNLEKAPTNSVSLVENASEKDYIFALLSTEKNIEILTKRLQELNYSQILYSKINERAKIRYSGEKEIKISDIRKNIDELSKFPKESEAEKYFSLIPPKPLEKFGKSKPTVPLYTKPNIFNKKKVTIENEQKKSNYEKQLALFEEELQQYNEERKKREDELKEYTNVLNKKTIELSEIRKKQIVQLEKKIDEIKSSTVDNNLETIKYVNQLNLCCEDISECEKLLKKFYQAKKQLLSLNVVFPKYANIVALSVIYEYLLVGRCTSLAGADGAYNLYESELRQNIIISKLDKIIDELEQIKENQFTTYQVLSEINDSVTGLNDKFGDVITSLNKIEANTQDIKELSEYVAYNTAKTAYYSKANAELANALGYMIALK